MFSTLRNLLDREDARRHDPFRCAREGGVARFAKQFDLSCRHATFSITISITPTRGRRLAHAIRIDPNYASV